jgi:2,3-bisphosphoglycerate-dependent phosphoglycerate mutase
LTAARRPSPTGAEDHATGQRAPDLVLLRHGESTANAAGLFTGAWDVPLTRRGRDQAARAASLISAAGTVPTLVVTSPLARAVQTVHVLLEEESWRCETLQCAALTERGYGALTGLRKDSIAELLGAARVHRWRRGLTARPPRLDEVAADSDDLVSRLLSMSAADHAGEVTEAAQVSESLADVISRVRRWHEEVLLPGLLRGESIIVVAHGNSLRALVAVLENMAGPEIERLNIPTGEPLRYKLSPSGRLVPGTGAYLDLDSAERAIRDVEREGGT